MALFENIFDASEQWEVDPTMDVKHIDGVAFVKAKRPGAPDSRYFLLRKEALKPSKPKDLFKQKT